MENKILKLVYFDEGSAADYLEILNKGINATSEEINSEDNRKIVAEISAELGAGFNLMSFLRGKATVGGKINSDELTQAKISQIITKTTLSDFLSNVDNESNFTKFNGVPFPARKSLTMLKMASPFLKMMNETGDEVRYSMVDDSLVQAKGYYEFLLDTSDKKVILRFNINSFRNGYGLSDLNKMKLLFIGVLVGKSFEEDLAFQKEIDYMNQFNDELDAEKKIKDLFKEINEETKENTESKGTITEDSTDIDIIEALEVYDILLAGVEKNG